MSAARPASPGRVTVVHADGDAAKDLARELRRRGHRVGIVEPSRRAAQQVIDQTPDLVLVSAALEDPRADGLARAVRQVLGADLPFVALVAAGATQPMVEADDLIREPVDHAELHLRLGSILRGRLERHRLQRKMQDLLGLYKISWAFSLAGGPEAVFDHLARHSAELLRADKAAVVLYERERRQLAFQHPAQGFTREQMGGARYAADEARERWNFRTNGPLISNRPQADSRVLPEIAVALDLHSLVVAPLIRGGSQQFHGLLLVADRVGHGAFTEDDLNLLTAVAGQATVAVENLKLHSEIRHKNALLEEYDRNKSEFVAMVSHDFRKPLMAIRGFAELVLEEPDLAADARQEFMRTVVTETEHLAQLAESTLLITRIETGELAYQFAEFDLGPFLLDCVPLGLSEHSVLLDVPQGLPPIVADADRLRQVVANLTSNAVKYSPGGGSIVVRVRLRGSEHVVIEVSDHGLGIPEDQVGRLFQKFARVRSETHMAVAGTGLGLYIARRIVEAHGGRIWIESEPGQGSTFGLVLPRDARKALAASAAAPRPASRAPRPRKG